MAVVVVRQRAPVHEVHELRNALIAVRIHLRGFVGEVVVPGGDARVDHRDADAGAVDTEALHDVGAYRDAGPVVVRLDRPVEVDAENLPVASQLLEQLVRHIEDVAVDDVERTRTCILPEFDRELGAVLERDDGGRRLQRVAVLRSPGDLIIQLVVLHEAVWDARKCFLRLTRSGPRRSRDAQQRACHRRQGPSGAPNSLVSDSRNTRWLHALRQSKGVAS